MDSSTSTLLFVLNERFGECFASRSEEEEVSAMKRTLQSMVAHEFMEDAISRAEGNVDAAHPSRKHWAAILPKLYIWFDIMSLSQLDQKTKMDDLAAIGGYLNMSCLVLVSPTCKRDGR